MVKVQEAEGGVIRADVGVVDGTDHALLVPSVERAQGEVFGHVPYVVATDRGFFKMDNVRRIEEMGVRCATVPKPGASIAELARTKAPTLLPRQRVPGAPGEARISRLKNTFGMRRTRYEGDSGVARSAHWAAIANNLMAIGVARGDLLPRL